MTPASSITRSSMPQQRAHRPGSGARKALAVAAGQGQALECGFRDGIAQTGETSMSCPGDVRLFQ